MPQKDLETLQAKLFQAGFDVPLERIRFWRPSMQEQCWIWLNDDSKRQKMLPLLRQYKISLPKPVAS